jgi:hypothetical protein
MAQTRSSSPRALERGRELRVVAEQDVAEQTLLDPLDAFGDVDLGRVVVGEEAVGLQPARGHQDEDPERRVAEAEAGEELLPEHPHLRVDLVDVAAPGSRESNSQQRTERGLAPRRAGRAQWFTQAGIPRVCHASFSRISIGVSVCCRVVIACTGSPPVAIR